MTTNTSSGELCIDSLPKGCYTTTVYNISIYDVIDTNVFVQRDIQDGVCTPIDLLQNMDSDLCAPFRIAVDAFNPLVPYQTTLHTTAQGILLSESVLLCQLVHIL